MIEVREDPWFTHSYSRSVWLYFDHMSKGIVLIKGEKSSCATIFVTIVVGLFSVPLELSVRAPESVLGSFEECYSWALTLDLLVEIFPTLTMI